MKKAILILVFLLFASPVFAIELEQAKQQGLVGETASGYLGAVSGGSAEVQELVNRINAERRQRYQGIAAKNNTPVSAVEALAGKKAIDMTQKGQFVQTAGGGWTKK